MTEPPLTIYQAMAKILADIDFIGKDRKADMGNAGKYNFRGIDDCYNALHSSFAKYKVFIIPKVIGSKIELQEQEKSYNGSTTKSYVYSAIVTIEFTFVSEDGSSISAVGIGHALDRSDKATNKAQSSALKYCLMQAFLIPTEESKDVEIENIQAVPVVVNSAPKKVDTAIEKAREAVKDCLHELDYSTEEKMAWAKTINPSPSQNWSLRDWERAVSNLHDRINEEDRSASGFPPD
jgi:hypothetical protein